MSKSTINDRSQQLLHSLVEMYIRDGQPVGSRTLAEETQLQVSSATIRNILSDLEERGYLHSPHTSAGRVPTAQGYRFFVDSLLAAQSLEKINLDDYQEALDPDQDAKLLVASASQLLSNVTKLAGVVTIPTRSQNLLRQVEFLPLSGTRVLVVLVINEREVQNRIIHTERVYSASELQQAANYLNQHYVGKELDTARQQLKQALQEDKDDLDSRMQAVIDVADKALDKEPTDKDYVMAGQDNLLSIADMQQVRGLFEAFNAKRDILHILDQCLGADGVQIFIGDEAGYDVLEDCSVVTTTYGDESESIGVVGVIGPTRMPYDKVIPMVDITARLLSSALKTPKD